MKGVKRSSPIPNIQRKPPKRSRLDRQVIEITDSEDEDDFDAILARISEQEERERRAHASAPGPSNFIVVDDTEGDEALARRLAHEWGEEQNQRAPNPCNGAATRETPLTHDNQSEMLEVRTVQDPQTRSPPVASSASQEQRNVFPRDLGPPDKRLSDFRDLFNGSRNCSKCQKPVAAPRGHVMFKSTDSILPPSVTHLLHAPCASCRTNHCRGCWTPISCTASCKGAPKKGECTITTCCAAGRAIAIFETLGGLDRQMIGERATSESRAMALRKGKAQKSHATVGPGGTGYGTDSSYPSYRSAPVRTDGVAAPKRSRAEGLAKHWDEMIVRAFNTLSELLPAPYSDSAQPYDLVPHDSVGILLSLSMLPELLAGLLRNDSVTDWITRSETYHAMLRLLRRMADCEITVQVLLERRWEVINSPGLEAWMWGEGEIVWQKDADDVIERGPPLYEYFGKLIKQGQTFMATVLHMSEARSPEGEETEETATQGISLCGDIIAAGADIERIMSILGVCQADVKEDSSSSTDKRYAAACDDLAFKHVVLASQDKKGKGTGLVYPNYSFAPNLNQTQSATRNPKNHFRLASELAMLATSLPWGVWVRVDEVRIDALKIMIAGPEGTPYEGGLFEFDCFMPLEYPNVPPLVHLCTTGGGTVGFNPNLYPCGKVCLSLLGTWPGRPEEQWSAKSTLLQVIVSIQSMILIDAPYFNEPGCGKANLKAPASITYNRTVSANTVRWAILDWMQDKHLNGTWGEVIVSHFSIKKNRIRERFLLADFHHPASQVDWWDLQNRGMGCRQLVNDDTHLRESSSSSPSRTDFVAEYDKCIQRIENWKGDI